MLLDFTCGSLFNVKMPNSKIILQMPVCSDIYISGPTLKFKILLSILTILRSEVSKKVCHTLVGQKLREEIDFLETSHFGPGL